MQQLNTNITLSDLDAWGTVEDLGSTIVEGDAKVYGKFTFNTPENPVNAGYFAVTKSIFRMTYPFDEQAVVIEGSVTFTVEATGEKFTFNKGDSWFVEKGTTVLWDVTSDVFIKHYMSSTVE